MFSEFVPTQTDSGSVFSTQDTIDQMSQLVEKNKSLQSQLDRMVADSEFFSQSADQQEIKDIILALRVSLGQGTASTDFETTFPYFPIPLERKNL